MANRSRFGIGVRLFFEAQLAPRFNGSHCQSMQPQYRATGITQHTLIHRHGIIINSQPVNDTHNTSALLSRVAGWHIK